MASFTGFVVAGGRSERMGRDKALLSWGAGTLLDHSLVRLREITEDVRVLCGPERRYQDRGAPTIVDALSESSALVGILSGLLALERPLGLFLAVDLPYVPAALLGHLTSLADGFDAVVPTGAGGPEPLCAVYGRECLEPIRRAVERGELKMTSFWSEVSVREVPSAELAAFGDPTRLFLNVNAPEDYERALL